MAHSTAPERAVTEAVRLTSHLRPRPLIAAVQGVVVALWPESVGVLRGEQLLCRAVASTHGGATAAVAVTELDSNGTPAAYRGARGALAFAAADGEFRTVVTPDDLGAAGLLLQYANPEELRRYVERTIGALRRYDTDHGAELFKTLRAYLNCDLDRRATGELHAPPQHSQPETPAGRDTYRSRSTLTSIGDRGPYGTNAD